jgi:hypothetical protein
MLCALFALLIALTLIAGPRGRILETRSGSVSCDQLYPSDRAPWCPPLPS